MYLTCITITQSTIITSPIGFNIGLTNVDARLKQRCINVVPTLCNVVSTLCNSFNVVSTSSTDVVSTLRNVKNPTSDFVSFSTSDQRYFNVDPQCWNNVDQTLKFWLGLCGIYVSIWFYHFVLWFSFSIWFFWLFIYLAS